jgi:hypothetical protein
MHDAELAVGVLQHVGSHISGGGQSACGSTKQPLGPPTPLQQPTGCVWHVAVQKLDTGTSVSAHGAVCRPQLKTPSSMWPVSVRLKQHWGQAGGAPSIVAHEAAKGASQHVVGENCEPMLKKQ